MRNFSFFIVIILTVAANVLNSAGDGESGFHRKRFDIELETCVENFEVHADKIIRTQDSRSMGAKYLNEAEVGGREECMKLCCETNMCDVFVFEQKAPGSCYLFHCGSPEDFKCKFTQHKNYTSAILTFGNRFGDSSTGRAKLTKHEEELNMLRKFEPTIESTSTTTSPSTKVPAIVGLSNGHGQTLKNPCSHYQFLCRESGECIAIYNACDGIPQCSDGSDEAPELECPTISGAIHPSTFHDQLKNLKNTNKNSSEIRNNAETFAAVESARPNKPPPAKPQSGQNQPNSPFSGYFPFGYPQETEEANESNREKSEVPLPGSNQPKYNGREGEIVQYPINGLQWQGYQPQRQEEKSYVANRKGTPVVSDTSDGQLSNPYSANDASRMDYIKFGGIPAGSGYYGGSGPFYYPGPNGWIQRIPQPPPHGGEDAIQRPVVSMYGNGIPGSFPSDYYYEDSQFRGRYNQVPQEPRRIYNPPDANHSDQKSVSSAGEKGKTNPTKEGKSGKSEMYSTTTEANRRTGENVKATSMPAIETVPVTSRTHTLKQSKSREETSLKMAEHLKMSESEGKNADGINERPSGAILSLTLGMCITAIMITLVGCRLRVVRKKMRRNGKSAYAHDSDFLVNGMYL